MPPGATPPRRWNASGNCLTTALARPNNVADTMLTLHGLAASRGYAVGRAVVLGAAALEVSHYRIAPEDAESECARLSEALTRAHEEFLRLADQLPPDSP